MIKNKIYLKKEIYSILLALILLNFIVLKNSQSGTNDPDPFKTGFDPLGLMGPCRPYRTNGTKQQLLCLTKVGLSALSTVTSKIFPVQTQLLKGNLSQCLIYRRIQADGIVSGLGENVYDDYVCYGKLGLFAVTHSVQGLDNKPPISTTLDTQAYSKCTSGKPETVVSSTFHTNSYIQVECQTESGKKYILQTSGDQKIPKMSLVLKDEGRGVR